MTRREKRELMKDKSLVCTLYNIISNSLTNKFNNEFTINNGCIIFSGCK